MKILSRYIIFEILGYFAISLLTFTGLLLTLRMLKLAALVINKGVHFSQVLTIFIAIIPTFLEIAIPMSALLGVMLAFARLSGDSEIIVARSSGISLGRLIFPVAAFGTAAALISLVVSIAFKPWGYREVSAALLDIARSKSTAGLSAGVFNKLGKVTLYASDIDHFSGDMNDVLVDDRRSADSRRVITAKTGQIGSVPEDGSIYFNLYDGQIHELVDQKYVLTDFNTNELRLAPEEMSDSSDTHKGRRSRELSLAELKAEIARYEEMNNQGDAPVPAATADEKSYDHEHSGKLTHQQVVKHLAEMRGEMGQRFAMPFAALILALIGMPLGIQTPRTQRTWGAGLSASLGMLVFVVYYGLLSFGITLAESGWCNPYFGVWFPNLVAGAIAWYGLRKMHLERWQSVSHAAEILLQRISGWRRPRAA